MTCDVRTASSSSDQVTLPPLYYAHKSFCYSFPRPLAFQIHIQHSSSDIFTVPLYIYMLYLQCIYPGGSQREAQYFKHCLFPSKPHNVDALDTDLCVFHFVLAKFCSLDYLFSPPSVVAACVCGVSNNVLSYFMVSMSHTDGH